LHRRNSDPYDLNRFVEAQEAHYSVALSELRSGRKSTHWIWYIFPQIAGLGHSAMSERYAIRSEVEARAYLTHPVLGPRIIECAEAVLGVENRSAIDIMGLPDDLKLKSCATLFAHVSPDESVFHKILDKYYSSEPDRSTLQRLNVGN
jgi:uncharacterized protein (DUF1810 family)